MNITIILFIWYHTTMYANNIHLGVFLGVGGGYMILFYHSRNKLFCNEYHYCLIYLVLVNNVCQ